MNKNSLGILIVALGLLFSCVDHNTFNAKVQLNKDIDSIQLFLKNNNITAESTPEGVYYIIDTKGLGIYPVASDSIQFEYSISYIPSPTSLLDTTHRNRDNSIPFKLLSSLIAGLQYGLPRFPVGSSGRLYIPSGLAYGTTGTTYTTLTIKGNRNLLFTIKKVVKVKGNRFTTDTTAVKNYVSNIAGSLLTENKGKLVKDPSGIRYWYDTLYSGALHPDLTIHSVIDITYKAKLMSSDTTHFARQTSVAQIDLKDQTDTRVITAWKLILPKISEGSYVNIYVPSGYGYGSNTSQPPLPPLLPNTSIPANSNLIYEMKLVKIY